MLKMCNALVEREHPSYAQPKHSVIVWESTSVDVKKGKLVLMKAQAGPYHLGIHDVTGDRGLLRIVSWGVTGPDGRNVGEGVCDTAEEAQAAAEARVRRLIGDVAAIPHPDAELLVAWDEFCQHYRTIDALPENDDVRAPHMEAMFAARDRADGRPAFTPAGALVKAKLAFIGYEETGKAADAMIYGKPYPAEELEKDYRDRLLWGLIGDLERMKGVSNTHTLGMERGVLNTQPPSPDPVKGIASTDTLGHPDAGLFADFGPIVQEAAGGVS